MLSQGFREHIRRPFVRVPEVGTYFDVIYNGIIIKSC
jgi:hypothetical protein